MKDSILDILINDDSEIYNKLIQEEDYEELYDEAYGDYNTLMGILNDEQKGYLKNFAEAQFAQKTESNKAYFKAGVKFGVRLLTECLSD